MTPAKTMPNSYRNAVLEALGGADRTDIGVDRYWGCFHDAMRRFSLTANSDRRLYGELANRWLTLPDSQLASSFEAEQSTQGEMLYDLEFEGPATPPSERSWDEKFYGKFEHRIDPNPTRDHWSRKLPLSFFVASYRNLHRPEYENHQIGWDDSRKADCLADYATNYLVRNCWHNFVHIMLQGIQSTNYHNFQGRARDEADMEADNLSCALLARSYGLPVFVTGLVSAVPPDSMIKAILRKNKCNRMFGERASRRAEKAEVQERYLRTLWNYLSGWLLADGYAAGSLGVYLGKREHHHGDTREPLRSPQVVAEVNGLRIATGIASKPGLRDEVGRRAHLRAVAQQVSSEYARMLNRDPSFKRGVESQVHAKFRSIGIVLR